MSPAVTLSFPFSAREAHARSHSPVQPDTLALVQSLPETTRRAVTLRFVYGFTQAEIAARLDLTPAEVVEHLARAVRVFSAEEKGAHRHA